MEHLGNPLQKCVRAVSQVFLRCGSFSRARARSLITFLISTRERPLPLSQRPDPAFPASPSFTPSSHSPSRLLHGASISQCQRPKPGITFIPSSFDVFMSSSRGMKVTSCSGPVRRAEGVPYGGSSEQRGRRRDLRGRSLMACSRCVCHRRFAAGRFLAENFGGTQGAKAKVKPGRRRARTPTWLSERRPLCPRGRGCCGT